MFSRSKKFEPMAHAFDVVRCLVKEKQDTVASMDPKTVSKIQALWRGYCSRRGRTLPCCWCNCPMALATPAEGSKRWAFQIRFGDPRFPIRSERPCATCEEAERLWVEKNHQDAMKKRAAAIKIQALWRGYRGREGEEASCCRCGYPMTLKRFSKETELLYCGNPEKRYPRETLTTWVIQAGKDPWWLVTCRSRKPCSWCEEEKCSECGEFDCAGGKDCERYIPCCICGNNCADGDYEQYRFCTRRCMVEAGRD